MDLPALEDFLLVARHGGFGRAARATGRSKATLSRRVAELETALGIRLFERGRHVPRLTEEGRALQERTAPLIAEIDDVTAGIAAGSGHPRGRLRISAPLQFGQVAMGRLAAGFAARYPDVRLEVTAEDRAADMVEDGYDLVIRVNPPADQALIGRCFLRDRRVVVAPPGLVRPEAGAPVPAVMLGAADASLPWRLRSGATGTEVLPQPVMRLSSLAMVRDAVRAGAGIALLPLSMTSRDIAAGRLVSWGDAEGSAVELWVLYTSRRLLSDKVTAFLDHLRKAFPEGIPEELAALEAQGEAEASNGG